LACCAHEPLGHDTGDLLGVVDDDQLDVAHCSPAASSRERVMAAFLRNRLRRLLRRAGETMFPPRAPSSGRYASLHAPLRSPRRARKGSIGTPPLPPCPPPPPPGPPPQPAPPAPPRTPPLSPPPAT